MKIQIIGYSGSGKSTLAKQLGQFYNIPYLYLDTVQFYGDWQERSKEEQNIIVNKFLDEHDNWIIDGNYSVVATKRFEISDITIFLNYNRFFCYRMAKKRYKMHKDTNRESNPCVEKFDRDFKKWILWDSRRKKRREKHISNLNKTKGLKLVFKNRNQLNKWLQEIGCLGENK